MIIMSKPYDKIYEEYKQLVDLFKDTLKKYNKINKTNVVRIAKRNEKKREWENEEDPISIIRLGDDYAWETREILATEMEFDDNRILVTEYFDDQKEKICRANIHVAFLNMTNIDSIEKVIEIMGKKL